MGSYIIFKTINGKKRYLSTTGKWITTAALAAVFSRDVAESRARELGGSIRSYGFRG